MSKSVEERERVVIRFAGDSGDGMQLAGGRFTDATAVLGNDLATLPNFPAEIRAPAGTLAGVSAFQIHFASRDILTPGDQPNVLVAMNPAALRANLAELPARGDDHRQRGRVHQAQPGEGRLRRQPARGRLAREFRVHRIPMTSLTVKAVEEIEDARPPRRQQGQEPVRARRAVVALRPSRRGHRAVDRDEVRPPPGGDGRPTSPRSTPAGRSGRRPSCSTSSTGSSRRPTPLPGTYRNINGTSALALGLVAASVRSGLRLVLASYPITPGLRAPARALAPRPRSASRRSRPRTRSPPPAWRSAPRSAAGSG